MLFLLYFGRKRSWKRDILGRAGYICRMRKKLLFLMAGAASVAGPVQAQFNTVSTVPFRYRVEVVSAGRDNAVTLPGYTLSVQDTLPPSGDAAPALSADTCKHVWIERYLSVSYPLRRMKINSLYGYRKDPFTGKRKFHNGIDLHARGDEVMAMMPVIRWFKKNCYLMVNRSKILFIECCLVGKSIFCQRLRKAKRYWLQLMEIV